VAERLPAFCVIYWAGSIEVEKRVFARHIRLPTDNLMAEVCLGVTVTSLYTLVGLGLIIVFI
jgi:hypothetical protein